MDKEMKRIVSLFVALVTLLVVFNFSNSASAKKIIVNQTFSQDNVTYKIKFYKLKKAEKFDDGLKDGEKYIVIRVKAKKINKKKNANLDDENWRLSVNGVQHRFYQPQEGSNYTDNPIESETSLGTFNYDTGNKTTFDLFTDTYPTANMELLYVNSSSGQVMETIKLN